MPARTRSRQNVRARRAWPALVWLALSALAGCRADSPPPSLLLVTVDTLRADHVSAYGYARETTPQIDALAAGGALFETAYAPMGTTSPSHATLFTSRHPLAHGLLRNGMRLPEAERTLAEILAESGFRCAAFVSSFPVGRRFGFDQGFARFDDRFDGEGTTYPMEGDWEGVALEGAFDRRATATVDAALAWHDSEDPGTRLFVWVHLFDPHDPYRPPPAYRFAPRSGTGTRDRLAARYDGEIRYADAELGRLVGALRATKRPWLVAITADHGEGLGDHGHPHHNRTLYEEELRVPWVVSLPGIVAPGQRIAAPVELGDVAPTLLGLVGVAPGVSLEGRDLSGWLRGDASGDRDVERTLLFERPFYSEGRPRYGEIGPAFGILRGTWKLIAAPREGRRELYDLARDPRERRNLAAADPERVKGLAKEALALREVERRKRLGEAATPLSAEERRALEALGYLDAPPGDAP